jgi:DNA-binding NarL/FixJ family response regulator
MKTAPGPTVLIVDDSIAFGLRLKQLLDEVRGVGTVLHVTLVSAARRLFPEMLPEIVIIDVRLPDGSGIDLLRELKRARPGLLAVVLTNHPTTCHRKASFQAGADHFFDKSSEFGSVVQVVHSCAEALEIGQTP